jgi:tetratricopeptide (TPR) repeat protein
MIRPKLTLSSVAIIVWLGYGTTNLISPIRGLAFETGEAYLVSHPAPEREAQPRNVLVLDNNLLDKVFGKHRASENSRHETARTEDMRVPRSIEVAPPSPILPNRSLLAGITRKVSPRRAAALRLAERGRVLLKNSDYQKALCPLEQALGLDANPFIYFYLARTHYHLGNHDRASGFLQVAEFSLVQQVEWMNEVGALRTAVSALAMAQQTGAVPLRNESLFIATSAPQ